MANRTQPLQPARGHALLAKFIKGLGITPTAAAEKLEVTKSVMSDWVNGRARPDAANRDVLATWSEGAVPVASWERDDERTRRKGIVPARQQMREAADAARAR